MTIEQLGAIAGIVLSLAIAYIPPFANWYNQKTAPQKAQIMAGFLILTAIGVFAYGCIPASLVPCTLAGAKELVAVLIAALVANQATFSLLVHPFKK
jgi:hypothetical protein